MADTMAGITTVTIGFGGAQLVLDPRRAVWWPGQSLLVVADMHLEKGRSYGDAGTHLPPYDTAATLSRLTGLLENYRPQRVACLGDSFHNAHVLAGLGRTDRFHLQALISEVKEWRWILGNHDPMEALPLPGHVSERMEVAGICLIHGDAGLPKQPTLLGHFHPKDTVHLAGRRLSGPCFAWSRQRLVLPAFGAYTGGLSVADPALRAVLGGSPCIGLIHGDTVGCYRKR